jgi:hypothetical protein
MSNLSELLPTGGGQNAVEFTAAENISSGQAVALKTDGQIEAADSANLANVIGLAAAAITSGATGDINVFGGINEVQSGLTIGSNYYINSSGSLTTSNSKPYVALGQAISATTINLRDIFDNYVAPIQGQQAYTAPGTYSWVAPAGVTSVSVVCIGGGGGGSSGGASSGSGAGTGYINNYTVEPGVSYSLSVGIAGTGGSGAGATYGAAAGDSFFVATGTVKGGKGITAFVSSDTAGGTYTGDGGGNGGVGRTGGNGGGGAGGAGGYSGTGGAGGLAGTSPSYSGTNGSSGAGGGGGGGGGGGIELNSPYSYAPGGGGGGVGVYGAGSNGAGGNGGVYPAGSGGSGGSGGGSGGSPYSNTNTSAAGGAGGQYGGGGGTGGSDGNWYNGGQGNVGAVRIIWSDSVTRAFPSTNTGDL